MPDVPPDDLSPLFRATRDRLDGQRWEATSQEMRRPTGRSPRDMEALIDEIAPRYGVDPHLMRALMVQESGGDPSATGPPTRHGKAQGLMQLIPATAARFGVQDPYDPVQNITGSAKFLAELKAAFPGRADLQIAGYHAGEGAVRRAGGVPQTHDGLMSTEAYTRVALARYRPGQPYVSKASSVPGRPAVEDVRQALEAPTGELSPPFAAMLDRFRRTPADAQVDAAFAEPAPAPDETAAAPPIPPVGAAPELGPAPAVSDFPLPSPLEAFQTWWNAPEPAPVLRGGGPATLTQATLDDTRRAGMTHEQLTQQARLHGGGPATLTAATPADVARMGAPIAPLTPTPTTARPDLVEAGLSEAEPSRTIGFLGSSAVGAVRAMVNGVSALLGAEAQRNPDNVIPNLSSTATRHGLALVTRALEAVEKGQAPVLSRGEQLTFWDKLASAVGTSVPFLALGGAMGGGFLGAMGAATTEALSEAGEVQKTLAPLVGDAEANRRAMRSFGWNVVLVGITDRLGIFGNASSAVRGIVNSIVTNGVQEAVQYDIERRQFWLPASHAEAKTLLAQGWVQDGDRISKPFSVTHAGEAALIGMVIGGGVSAGVSLAVEREVPAVQAAVDADRVEVAPAIPATLVQDADGKPLRVYHGTSAAFDTFDMTKAGQGAGGDLYGPGLYFTADAEIASGYATSTASPAKYVTDQAGVVLEFPSREHAQAYLVAHPALDASTHTHQDSLNPQNFLLLTDAQVSSNVRPSYLDIQHPFDIAAPLPVDEAEALLRSVGIVIPASTATPIGLPTGQEVYDRLVEHVGDKAAANQALQAAGYDGITHMGGTEDATHHVYIAFSPDQVHPAFGIDAALQAAQTPDTPPPDVPLKTWQRWAQAALDLLPEPGRGRRAGRRGGFLGSQRGSLDLFGGEVPAVQAAVEADRVEVATAIPATLVQDADGKPLRVYHGTSAAFEQFDMSRASTGAGGDLYGPGLYFTADPDVAGGTPEQASAGTGDPRTTLGYASGHISPTMRADAQQLLAQYQTPRDLRQAVQAGTFALPSSLENIVWDESTLGAVVAEGLDATGTRGLLPLLQDVAHGVARVGTPNVRPAYLDIQHPFDIAAPLPVDEAEALLRSVGIVIPASTATPIGLPTGQEVYDRVVEHVGDKAAANQALQAAGYDGITHIGGTGDTTHQVYIAFSPDQVHPAFGIDAALQAAQTPDTPPPDVPLKTWQRWAQAALDLLPEMGPGPSLRRGSFLGNERGSLDLFGGETPAEPDDATPDPVVRAEALFPRAEGLVDGRTVREDIPNTDSIGATYDEGEYTVLPGVRAVPIAAFGPGNPAMRLDTRTQRLADEIAASGEINPLIIAIDATGPYILEGGHRFDALDSLGATSIPALVVVTNDAQPEALMQAQAATAAPDEGTLAQRLRPGEIALVHGTTSSFEGLPGRSTAAPSVNARQEAIFSTQADAQAFVGDRQRITDTEFWMEGAGPFRVYSRPKTATAPAPTVEGSFWSPTTEAAEVYARKGADAATPGRLIHAALHPTAVIKTITEEFRDTDVQAFLTQEGATESNYQHITELYESPDFQQYMRDAGYDGIQFTEQSSLFGDTTSVAHTSYLILNPATLRQLSDTPTPAEPRDEELLPATVPGPRLRAGAEGLTPEHYRDAAGRLRIPLKDMPSRELELQDLIRQQGGVRVTGTELRGEFAAVLSRAETGIGGLQNNASGLSVQQMAEVAEQLDFIASADTQALLDALDRSVTQGHPVYSLSATGRIPLLDDPFVQASYQALTDAIDTMGPRTEEQVGGVRHRADVHAEAQDLIDRGQWTLDDIREIFPNTTLNDTMASALLQALNTLGRQVSAAAQAYLDSGERTGSPEEHSLQEVMGLLAELDPVRMGVSAAQSRGLGILNDPLSSYTQFLNNLRKVLLTAPDRTMGQIARRLVAAQPMPPKTREYWEAHPEELQRLFAGIVGLDTTAFHLEADQAELPMTPRTAEEQALLDAAYTSARAALTPAEWETLRQNRAYVQDKLNRMMQVLGRQDLETTPFSLAADEAELALGPRTAQEQALIDAAYRAEPLARTPAEWDAVFKDTARARLLAAWHAGAFERERAEAERFGEHTALDRQREEEYQRARVDWSAADQARDTAYAQARAVWQREARARLNASWRTSMREGRAAQDARRASNLDRLLDRALRPWVYRPEVLPETDPGDLGTLGEYWQFGDLGTAHGLTEGRPWMDPEQYRKATLRAVVQSTQPGFEEFGLELWFNGMLSNPATHIANAVGNAGMTLWAMPERYVAGALRATGATGTTGLTGQEHGVVADEGTAMLYGLTHGLHDAWTVATRAFALGEPVSGLGREYARPPMLTAANLAATPLGQTIGFDPASPLGRFVDFWFEYIGVPWSPSGGRLPSRFLMASDEFFKMLTYRMELNALAYREAVREGYEGTAFAEHVARIVSGPTLAQIQQAATEFSVIQTFQQALTPGKLGERLQGFQQWRPQIPWTAQTFPAGRVLLPFVVTPSNIARQALERTPLGAGFASVREDINAGGARRDNAYAKMGLGTVAMVTFAGLAMQGLLTGRAPEDPELRAIWLKQHPEYAIRTPWGWVSLARFEPVGMLAGSVADAVQIAGEVDEMDLETGIAMLWYPFLKNIVSKTYMQSLSQFFEVAAPRVFSVKPEATVAAAQRYIRRQGASMLFPSSLAAATARVLEPAEVEIASFWDALYARVLGWGGFGRSGLAARRTLGGEKLLYGMGVGEGLLLNTLRAYVPFRMEDGKLSAADKEILKNKMDLSMPPKYLDTRAVRANELAPTRDVDVSQYKPLKLTAQEYERFVVLSAGNQVEAKKLGLELPTPALEA